MPDRLDQILELQKLQREDVLHIRSKLNDFIEACHHRDLVVERRLVKVEEALSRAAKVGIGVAGLLGALTVYLGVFFG